MIDPASLTLHAAREAFLCALDVEETARLTPLEDDPEYKCIYYRHVDGLFDEPTEEQDDPRGFIED